MFCKKLPYTARKAMTCNAMHSEHHSTAVAMHFKLVFPKLQLKCQIFFYKYLAPYSTITSEHKAAEI